MSLISLIKEDLRINKDVKIKFVLFVFRIGNHLSRTTFFLNRILYYGVKLFYKVVVEYIMNIELPINLKVGKGLKIEHGTGLVINSFSIIGDYVSLKHNSTIGCKTNYTNRCIKQCIIGDHVVINPHSCIIGVTIGSNSIVGAGSIVTKDFEPYSIIVGNPGRLLKRLEPEL